MMWFGLLLTLIFIGGSFCDEDNALAPDEDCFWNEMEACDRSMLPRSYPQDGEELLNICRNIITYGSCIVDALKTCDENDDDMELVQDFVSYVRTTCQEDNPTFEVISNNLQCIERVSNLWEHTCIDAVSDEKQTKFLGKYFNTLFEKKSKEFTSCLFAVIETTCRSVKYAHHCGTEVAEAAEDVYINFRIAEVGHECTPEFLDEIQPLQEAYQALLFEELELENALKKRRK